MASSRRRNGGDDDDRRLCSRPLQPQQQSQQRRRLHNLYVKDLPEFADEACLVALFSRFGGAVVSARVLRGIRTRRGRSRGGRGGGGGRRGIGGGGGGGDTSLGSSSRSPDSSKRHGFVEMATAEGASAAISALDGRFLALRGEDEEAGTRGGSTERRELVALSPSLGLLVSDKPLSSGAAHAEHCVRVAHALSKEAREQGAARAKAEARAAVAAEARLRRARAAVEDERNRRPGRGSVSASSSTSSHSSSSRWPPRGASGGGGGAGAGRW